MDIVRLLAHSWSCTDFFFSFLMVRHPNVMEKLRAEISKFDGVKLTRNELRNMSYLQNVLKESKHTICQPSNLQKY
jgi:hypothetical protein